MRRYLMAVCAAVSLSCGDAAFAQTAPDAASATRLELARRFAEVSRMREQVDIMMDTLLPQMIASLSRDLPEKDRAMAQEVIRESIRAVTPQMIDRAVEASAEVLTEAELKAIITFYESPEGRSFVEKQALLNARTQAAMSAVYPQLVVELQTRLCAKLGQGPGCVDAAKASKS